MRRLKPYIVDKKIRPVVLIPLKLSLTLKVEYNILGGGWNTLLLPTRPEGMPAVTGDEGPFDYKVEESPSSEKRSNCTLER